MRVLLSLSLLTVVSCATMTSGRYETIDVHSTPEAANAVLTCEEQAGGGGVTPTSIRIRRNAGDCNLTVAKDGYEDALILIEQGVNPAYWLNMFFSFLGPTGGYLILAGDTGEQVLGVGILGAATAIFFTDFKTGAVHQHKPKKIDVVLKAKQ